jgi:hypothetical protein
MSNATSEEEGRIVTASANQSCVQSHKCPTRIVIECVDSRFGVEPFNIRNIRC